MLQKGLIILLLGLSLQVNAGQFDFLPAGQGAEAEFKSLMNAGNFKPALLAWNSAHGVSAFGQSADGKATLAYLLYQNGMPLAGLDLVLSTSPQRLSPAILKLWSSELGKSVWVQKGWIQTSGGWKTIHNNEIPNLKIRNKRDITAAFKKADGVNKENVNFKARIWWQIATLAPQINEVDSALKALKLIKESGQTAIGADQISSAQARVLYQKGDLEAALQSFHEIPKSSNLWVESVEERAWTHLRRDDYDKALGETVTLLSPALAKLVGPESYYLTNLLALKVCDYPRIFKTSELFKTRHKGRLAAFEEFTKTGSNKNMNELLARLEQKGVSIEAAGPQVEWLPRAAYRDHKFLRFMESRREWLAESKKADELIANGDALGASPQIQRLAQDSRAIADRLKQFAYARVRTLASAELNEYRQNLDKMHIIEGEVIHRLAVDDNLKGQRSKLAKVEDNGDVLVFPYNSNEVWFDELDNYKARVKDCPTLKGAGL